MRVENIRSIKIELRAKYRAIRENMDKNRQRYLDKQILNFLIETKAYKNAPVIFTYVSKSIEVDTIGLINQALLDNKRVAVPRCVPNERLMDFYYINSVDDLEVGSFGVLEPIASRCKKVTDFSKGLCIVPGFCFDSFGYRLGYGKGYYDRFLPLFKGTKVGLCYSSCITSELPHGYFDRPIHILITDKYIRKIEYKNFIKNKN